MKPSLELAQSIRRAVMDHAEHAGRCLSSEALDKLILGELAHAEATSADPYQVYVAGFNTMAAQPSPASAPGTTDPVINSAIDVARAWLNPMQKIISPEIIELVAQLRLAGYAV